MSNSPVFDDIGEQLLAELRHAPGHQLPRVNTLEDGKFSIGTHIGIRRSRNEDRVAIARVDTDACSYLLAVVCDGVGSSSRGDEAAAIACAAMISLLGAQSSYRPSAELLPELVRGADDILRQRLAGSGLTTVCALLATNKQDFSLTNVGDSRAYSWEQHGELIQLTEDDTLENEVKRLNLPAQSFLNERRLEGSLSQALGETGRLSNDLRIKVVERKSIPPGGLLLVSDGVWVSGEEFFQRISKNCGAPGDLARRILTSAFWLGGYDNASAIVIADPQLMPAASTLTGSHARITVWLPETKLVLYRSANRTPNPENSGPGTWTKKKAAKKKGSKTPPAKQLELADAEQKEKARDIIAGPDES